MTGELTSILIVVRLLSALRMVWPAYPLVAVNNRARLGPPLGDRTDVYLENVIKNRTIPCFVFQGTAFVTGVSLVLLREVTWDAATANPRLLGKLFVLAAVAALLSYVHLGLQPAIDAGFEQFAKTAGPMLAARIGALR